MLFYRWEIANMEVIEVEADDDFMEYYSIKEEFANIKRVLAQNEFKQGLIQEASTSSKPQSLVSEGKRCVTESIGTHRSYCDEDKSLLGHKDNAEIYERFSIYNNPDDDEDANDVNNIIYMSNNGEAQGYQRGQISLLQNCFFRDNYNNTNITLYSQSNKENTTRRKDIEQTEVNCLDARNQSNQCQIARQTTAVYKQKHKGKKHTFYQCGICRRYFPSSSVLTKHTQLHSEKPFQCGVCMKQFSEAGDLSTHIVRIHNGKKPFDCKHCEKAFSCRSNLIKHERIHTGERPYKCNKCGDSFKQVAHLQQHERTHTGERPYRCNECGESFRQITHLRKHNRTHTGERPHKCNECGDSFKRVDHLVRHKRRHTGGKPSQVRL